MTEKPPNLILVSIDKIDPNEYDEFIGELNSAGISNEFETHTGGPYAFLEWLIPTAVCLYITKSYFDGFLKEAGKQHYHALDQALTKLYSKFLGDNPKYNLRLKTVGKKLSDPLFAYALSLVFVTDDCHQIKLLFQGNISEANYIRSISEFRKLVDDFQSNYPDSPIAKALHIETQHYLWVRRASGDENPRPPKHTILVYFDHQENRFYQADPIASSKAGALISRPLGEEWPNPALNSDAASARQRPL